MVNQSLVRIEVVFDRRLAGTCDEEQSIDARLCQFFDHILDDRLAANRQHLLGLRLGRGKKTCSQSGDGDNSDINAHREKVSWSVLCEILMVRRSDAGSRLGNEVSEQAESSAVTLRHC